MRIQGVFGCLLLLVACAPHAAPTSAPTLRDATTLEVSRHESRTLHADVDFGPDAREQLERAADRWHSLTQGRADLRVVFDLDFSDLIGLQEHHNANHDVVIAVTSDLEIVSRLDALTHSTPASQTVATTSRTSQDARVVHMIVDRFDPDELEGIATHEFGHVLGLPDLPSLGSVMSGVTIRGARAVEFSSEDAALCRAYRFCR